jgi:hypothetical protein
MRRVLRRLLPAVLVVPLVSGAAPAAPTFDLRGSAERTKAGGSARFSLSVAATLAGASVRTSENGTVSFTRRLAHVYKLVPGRPIPEELILDGPFTYTNANVQAALANPAVRPWTKLDVRRLPRAQRRRVDDLDHVRALAYLGEGVVGATRVGAGHVRGTVEPARVLARVPRSERAAIRVAIRSDYAAGPFRADFWLDAHERIRRVHVAYRTARGGRIVVDGRLSSFGVAVDVKPPPASEIEDISP